MSELFTKEQFYEAFQLMAELTDYAEEKKHKLAVGTIEHSYWQGTADACRKIGAAMRGSDLYSDLYQELETKHARNHRRRTG